MLNNYSQVIHIVESYYLSKETMLSTMLTALMMMNIYY